MTNDERQQSLIRAREACVRLRDVATLMETEHPMRIDLECLLAEFKRLDDKEQKQIKEGKRGGKLGGRPRKNEVGATPPQRKIE